MCLRTSAAFLPRPWNYGCLGAQLAFYALAAADAAVPERFFVKRVSSIARTFTTLMLASLAAAAVLFVPPERLWGRTEIRAPKA